MKVLSAGAEIIRVALRSMGVDATKDWEGRERALSSTSRNV